MFMHMFFEHVNQFLNFRFVYEAEYNTYRGWGGTCPSHLQRRMKYRTNNQLTFPTEKNDREIMKLLTQLRRFHLRVKWFFVLRQYALHDTTYLYI
jgi:hypothetical protein